PKIEQRRFNLPVPATGCRSGDPYGGGSRTAVSRTPIGPAAQGVLRTVRPAVPVSGRSRVSGIARRARAGGRGPRRRVRKPRGREACRRLPDNGSPVRPWARIGSDSCLPRCLLILREGASAASTRFYLT